MLHNLKTRNFGVELSLLTYAFLVVSHISCNAHGPYYWNYWITETTDSVHALSLFWFVFLVHQLVYFLSESAIAQSENYEIEI